MSRAKNVLLSLRPVRILLTAARKHSVPGAGGISLYDMGRFFIRELRSVKLTDRVAAVTYNFLMALPPTMLLIFSLLPYLPLKNAQIELLKRIRIFITNDSLYNSIKAVIENFIITERRTELSFGVLLVLFFSSNGMMGLMRNFDKSMAVYKQRSGLRRRWHAIKLTFILQGVILGCIAVFLIETRLIDKFIREIFGSVVAVKIFGVLVLLAMVFCAISIIYTYGPSLVHPFKFFSVGSVFATVMSAIVTTVFFFLVNNFLHYNQLYGSIGSLIAFLVWLWLNVLILFIGFELNVSILLGKISQKGDVKALQEEEENK